MRVALVFPGQGSQEVGMGRSLSNAFPEARAVFEEADVALAGARSISQLCFEGPLEDLTLTANTQPAVLTASIAAFRALEARLVSKGHSLAPVCAAGHSLGEYSALVSVGALALSDTVRLVRLRGESMQQAVPAGEGAMAALVGLEGDDVALLCSEVSKLAPERVVSPANFNAPGQVVVAGHADAVDRLVKLAGERRVRAIPLKVSAPFHCSLMEPAGRVVRDALASVRVGAFRCPVVSNVDALPYQDAATLRDVLHRQVAGSVKWDACVRKMIESGVEAFIEVGPGKVLAGLIKRINRQVTVHNVFDPQSLESTVAAITA